MSKPGNKESSEETLSGHITNGSSMDGAQGCIPSAPETVLDRKPEQGACTCYC